MTGEAPSAAAVPDADEGYAAILRESLIDLDTEAADLRSEIRALVERLEANRWRHAWTRVELDSLTVPALEERTA